MNKNNITEKSYEDTREHFIERLKERYNLDMTHDEYDKIATEKNFTFLIKKSSDGVIGTLNFKNTEVFIFYNKTRKIPSTALTPLNDELDFIMTVFGKRLQHIARTIYNSIMDEMKPHLEKNFETVRDAAIYYHSNSPFANFLVQKYVRGKWDTKKMIQTISDIMHNEHAKCKLVVTTK